MAYKRGLFSRIPVRQGSLAGWCVSLAVLGLSGCSDVVPGG